MNFLHPTARAYLGPKGLAGVLAVAVLVACSQDVADVPAAESNPLFIDPETFGFESNPELLERVLSSPHGYFRLINIPFSQEVCRTYAELLGPYPDFNLHGDSHIEQYAVTDLGRGLTDFDDSSLGPALVDLSRFGVSLWLASEANGWGSSFPDLFGEFFAGYRLALESPREEAPEPDVVARLKENFESDRKKYFEWIEEISEPIPTDEERALLAAMKLYFSDVLARRPDLTDQFFEVVGLGSLRLGIGSALDRKYLVQIRGDSDMIFDDVVLELKQVRDLSGIDCVVTGRGADPYRILMGQSIAYKAYELLGYIRLEPDTFWVHAWVDNYDEVSILESFESPQELAQVAFDVGVQLGRGHPNQLNPPLDVQLRREQLRLLDRDEVVIRDTTVRIAAQVSTAWQTFKDRSKVD